jgi:hypothetical protein
MRSKVTRLTPRYGIKIMAVHPAASQGSTYESDGYSIHSSAVGSQPGSPTRGIDAFPASNGHSKAAIPDLVHSEVVLAVEQSLGGVPILQAQPSGSDSQTALAQSLTADSGTWKQRQFVMPPPAAERDEPAASGTLPSQMSAARDVGKPARTRAHTDDEEAAVAAAWKWRFCRRWKAEQVRVVDPEHASGGSDNMADALLYLNAAGQNNVDLSRTASADLTELRQSLGTAGTMGLLSGECFSESFSATQQPALAGGEHQPHASQQVASVAKQAQKLLQQQRELERKAEERCALCSGGAGGRGAVQFGGCGRVGEGLRATGRVVSGCGMGTMRERSNVPWPSVSHASCVLGSRRCSGMVSAQQRWMLDVICQQYHPEHSSQRWVAVTGSCVCCQGHLAAAASGTCCLFGCSPVPVPGLVAACPPKLAAAICRPSVLRSPPLPPLLLLLLLLLVLLLVW